MKRCKAFTLVELSVVIGIIVILISIALPVLNRARDHAKAVACQSNLRVLWQGFMCFAADHDNRMPGCWADQLVSNTPPDRCDWLFGQSAPVTDGGGGGYNTEMLAPQSGTIFKYVGHNYNVFRCPALDLAENGNNIGPGGASNGRFDYTAFEFFSGAHVARLPRQAQLIAPSGTVTMLPCPVITEESAATANGAWKDSNHAQGDQMGHQHWGGGYYVATDGSVQYFVEPADCTAIMYAAATVRQSKPPVWIGNGYSYQTWGWWETQ